MVKEKVTGRKVRALGRRSLSCAACATPSNDSRPVLARAHEYWHATCWLPRRAAAPRGDWRGARRRRQRAACRGLARHSIAPQGHRSRTDATTTSRLEVTRQRGARSPSTIHRQRRVPRSDSVAPVAGASWETESTAPTAAGRRQTATRGTSRPSFIIRRCPLPARSDAQPIRTIAARCRSSPGHTSSHALTTL